MCKSIKLQKFNNKANNFGKKFTENTSHWKKQNMSTSLKNSWIKESIRYNRSRILVNWTALKGVIWSAFHSPVGQNLFTFYSNPRLFKVNILSFWSLEYFKCNFNYQIIKLTILELTVIVKRTLKNDKNSIK